MAYDSPTHHLYIEHTLVSWSRSPGITDTYSYWSVTFTGWRQSAVEYVSRLYAPTYSHQSIPQHWRHHSYPDHTYVDTNPQQCSRLSVEQRWRGSNMIQVYTTLSSGWLLTINLYLTRTYSKYITNTLIREVILEIFIPPFHLAMCIVVTLCM